MDFQILERSVQIERVAFRFAIEVTLEHAERKSDLMKNKKMKIARIECDLSQEQLADKVGVTRQTIGMIESGNYNPSLNLCIEICKALNKTLNDLFWEE